MRESIFVASLLFAGCMSPGEFKCDPNVPRQCVHANGTFAQCIAAADRCALLDSSCPSGYRYDKNAGELAGLCVSPGLMTGGGAPDGMAASEDLAPALAPDLDAPTPTDPVDMALNCAHAGEPCTSGTGACQATGKIVCTPRGAACDAVAIAPDSSWHSAAAANGSWDWNCDGKLEYQYPSGDTTPPQTPGGAQCAPRATQGACEAPIYFYNDRIYSDPSQTCGAAVLFYPCAWTTQCKWLGGITSVPQGCH